jgi:hypothetical protein
MKYITLDGKKYRISYDGHIEVYVPAGEPRVMRKAIRAYWRIIKRDSSTYKKVKKATE